ncbi:MAG: DUF58 domain-containing protein [Phycisphaeraceae bacterium]
MTRPTYTRLQVGPTGWAYLFILAAAAGAGFYTQANLMFLAVGLLLGALVVSLFWVWLSLREIAIERLPPDHGVTGDEVVLRYQLDKQSRLPAFGLLLTETWGRGKKGYRRQGPMREQPPRLLERPTGWVVHLGSGQTLQAQASCWPTRRGDLELARIEVHSDFPFGIVRRVLVFDEPDSVLVLPRLYRVTRGVMTKITRLDAGGYHQLDKEGGTEEFFALRDYRMGDSLKVIDWKHSAKVGKLVSRELTQPVPPSLVIYLDLSAYAPKEAGADAPPIAPDDMRRVDRAVDLAASLVCDAYQAGYRVGLSVNGADTQALRAHHSLPHRGKLLETLARLEPGSAPAMRRYTGEAPSVIVRPDRGKSQAVKTGRRAVVVSGEDLERLCVQTESRHALAARSTPALRREAPASAQGFTGPRNTTRAAAPSGQRA